MKLLKKEAFGETRIVLMDDLDQPVRIFVSRESALNLGETVNGAVTSHNKTLRGYFVITEKGESVFVPSTEKKAEGDAVIVEITKEARLGKDATGQFVTFKKEYNFTKQVIDETGIFEIQEWIESTEVIEEALETGIPFANGAALHIERTNACWTIDVDSGGSALPLSQINALAVPVIAAQIKLKNLSGLILIDFAGFKSDAEQKSLHTEIKKQLRTDKRTTLYGFSKTHLYEMKRKRTSAALADVFLSPNGCWNIPTTVYNICTELTRRKCPKIILAHPSVLPFLKEKIPAHIELKPNFNCELYTFEIIGE